MSYENVLRIKAENPLILNLTNNVTMDFIANGLLSLGASPIMSEAPEEFEDLLNNLDAMISTNAKVYED